MYCYVIYHPASFQVAEFYLSVTRKYCFPTSFDKYVWWYMFNNTVTESLRQGHASKFQIITSHNRWLNMTQIWSHAHQWHYSMENTEAYYENANQLAQRLLRAFAMALELPEDWFVGKTDKHVSALRSNNYPDQANMVVPEGSIRCSAHTDYGTLTILKSGRGRAVDMTYAWYCECGQGQTDTKHI